MRTPLDIPIVSAYLLAEHLGRCRHLPISDLEVTQLSLLSWADLSYVMPVTASFLCPHRRTGRDCAR
jgi:hypothetical protein